MKSYRRPTSCKPMWTFTMLLVVIAILSGGGAYAAPQYTISCDTCHRMPPLDSATGTREPDTGAFKGNHQAHATAQVASCVKCHGAASATYATNHRNKTIEFSANLNGSAVSSTYSRGFVNQSSVPPATLGTCSNANCHFEAVTPAWGSAALTAPAGCSVCHGAAPNDGNHPGATNGAKHAAYYGSGTGSCVKCHPDHLADGNPFAHATSAGHRSLALQFVAAPNSGGTYSKSANLNYPNYLPSQNPLRNGTCASLYCHSDGRGGAAATTPTWGGTLAADCTGCHGGNSTSAAAIASGSHPQHVSNAALLGTTFECARCHNATVALGSERAISDVAKHVDGQKNVSFSNGGSYAGSTCSATLCHAAGKSAAPQPAAPIWGGAALDCKGCHGVGSAYGEPNYTNAGSALDLANSHNAKHISSAASCANCHAATTANGTSIVSGSAHLNGAVNVSFSATYDRGGAAYNNAIGTKSCANIYCHSNGSNANPLVTPQWGASLPADCSGCHGGDAQAIGAIATGKHAAHMKNYTTLGRGNNLSCGECHAKTVTTGDNRAITTAANHINTLKDYSGARAGKSYVQATGVCSNVYCHSSGQATLAYRNMTGSKAWGGSAKFSCNGCHGSGSGAFTPVAGEPNYAGGAVGSGNENSHLKHTVGSNMTDSRGCAKCHRSTVDASVAGKLRDYSSAHLNKKRDVTFASLGNYTGHYTASSKTCSNTYCHAGTDIQWGTAGPLACNSCHKADATLAGAHNKHWSATGAYPTSYSANNGNSGDAANYRFECANCHKGTHAGGPAPAGNGNAAEILFNYSSGTRIGSYTYGATTQTDGTLKWSNGTCATTYCHSDGRGGNPNVDTTGFNWNSGAVLGCTGCHGGNAASSNPIVSGKHTAHTNAVANSSLGTNNQLGCAVCHAKTVSADATLSNKKNHVNRFKDYSGLQAGRLGATCSTVYCHSNGKGVYVNMTGSKNWSTGTLANIGCNGCHGRTDLNGAPDYSAGNSHAKHMSTFVSMGAANNSTTCSRCHVRTVDAATAGKFRNFSTQHLNGSIQVNIQATYGGSYAGNVCSNVSCHSNGKGGYQPVTWGAAGNCALCHPMNQLSRGHSFHVYTSASNAPTAYLNYTANKSVTSRYNFGCANCHPNTNANHTSGTVLVDFKPGAATAVGYLKSKNGSNITVGGVVAGTANSGTLIPSAGQLKCANIYCHSNGMSGASFKAYTTPDWYAGNFTGDRCAACHGNSPNSGGKTGSAAHSAHVISIHNDDIAAANGGLIAPAGIAGTVAGHGDSAQATTINCNTCHYATVTTAANDNNTVCVTCHGATKQYGASAKGAAAIANKGMHVNGRADISFQATSVVSKAQMSPTSFANATSVSNNWTRSAFKTGTSAFDTAKKPLANTMFAVGGGCSNISCHNGKPVNWYTDNGNGAQCVMCHSNL